MFRLQSKTTKPREGPTPINARQGEARKHHGPHTPRALFTGTKKTTLVKHRPESTERALRRSSDTIVDILDPKAHRYPTPTPSYLTAVAIILLRVADLRPPRPSRARPPSPRRRSPTPACGRGNSCTGRGPPTPVGGGGLSAAGVSEVVVVVVVAGALVAVSEVDGGRLYYLVLRLFRSSSKARGRESASIRRSVSQLSQTGLHQVSYVLSGAKNVR